MRKRARERGRAWLHLYLTDEEQTEAGLVSSRDRLVVRLAAINGKMPQSRPRYFSLVQLPEQQALSFAASYPAFNRDWLGADGSLIFLLARTGAGSYDALLRRGLVVRPMAGFGVPDHVRITIGLAEENRRLIDALRALRATGSPEPPAAVAEVAR